MEKIIVCGAGEVGFYTAELLSKKGHKVTVIDISEDRLKKLEEIADVNSVIGSACHFATLADAGVENCDLLIAATNQDEVNLLTSVLGKHMGAKKTIVRLHHRSYLEASHLDYRHACGADHFVCPEQLTSTAILEKLENPGVLAVENFAHGMIQMQRFAIKKGSPIIGVELKDFTMPKGLYLAVVLRGNHSFVPTGHTVLQQDDTVTIVGETKRFNLVQKIFNVPQSDSKNIAIVGASLISEWLIEKMQQHSFKVRLFVEDHDQAFKLSEKYPHITVLNSDPIDPKEFRRERLDECNAFIAVSENAEQNILSVLQAKQLGTAMTMAVIFDSTFLSLIEGLGVDFPFSPRNVAVRELLKLVDDSPVRRIATLAPGVAEVYELDPVANGSALNNQLMDIKFPPGHFIVAIQRGERVYLPSATDHIRKGDILIVIGPSGTEELLIELFIGK